MAGITITDGKTLLVPDNASVSGTNTGDVTLTGQNYLSLTAQQITANAIDLSSANATGTLAAARMPALTGDVTTSAGSVATTIANNAVTNAKAAQMAAHTLKGNNTGSAANPADLTIGQVQSMLGLTAPTLTTYQSGSGTYTAPVGCVRLHVRLIGGGGQGGGANSSGTSGSDGANGGNTTFSTLTANGGQGGKASANFSLGGDGGTASGGDLNFSGTYGGHGNNTINNYNGGEGGGSVFAGRGQGGLAGNGGGNAVAPGSGGGGGGGAGGSPNSAGGGGAGGYCEDFNFSPGNYSYAVGSGATSSNGTLPGGSGAAGIIIIQEYYS